MTTNPDPLREALERLLKVAFKNDMFLTQNGIPMEATPNVRRAVKQARAALAQPQSAGPASLPSGTVLAHTAIGGKK